MKNREKWNLSGKLLRNITNLSKNKDGESKKKGNEYMSKRYGEEKGTSTERASVDWKKFHNPLVPKPALKKTVVVEDYLLNQRLRRGGDNEEDPRILRGIHWQNISADKVDDADK